SNRVDPDKYNRLYSMLECLFGMVCSSSM
ncbi:hypothetical protein AVEN_250008-1, partial [Araneus ventricosus]